MFLDHKNRKIYIVQEYCDGGDMASYIREKREKNEKIKEEFIWGVLGEIASALLTCVKGDINNGNNNNNNVTNNNVSTNNNNTPRKNDGNNTTDTEMGGDCCDNNNNNNSNHSINSNNNSNKKHKGRILHRDLKPGNAFLVSRGNSYSVKLGDFGLARVLGDQSVLAKTHVGTPYYMSPEQVLSLSVFLV